MTHHPTTAAQIIATSDTYIVCLDDQVIATAMDLLVAAELLSEHLGMLREDGLLPGAAQQAWESAELAEQLAEHPLSSGTKPSQWQRTKAKEHAMITIIDNNANAARELTRMLPSPAWRVPQMADSSDLQGAEPALIISSIHQRGERGARRIEEIRAVSAAPLTAVLHAAAIEDELHCLRRGINEVLVAPVHPEGLRLRVAPTLREKARAHMQGIPGISTATSGQIVPAHTYDCAARQHFGPDTPVNFPEEPRS
jgi:CheY-like chemotaxis protein